MKKSCLAHLCITLTLLSFQTLASIEEALEKISALDHDLGLVTGVLSVFEGFSNTDTQAPTDNGTAETTLAKEKLCIGMRTAVLCSLDHLRTEEARQAILVAKHSFSLFQSCTSRYNSVSEWTTRQTNHLNDVRKVVLNLKSVCHLLRKSVEEQEASIIRLIQSAEAGDSPWEREIQKYRAQIETLLNEKAHINAQIVSLNQELDDMKAKEERFKKDESNLLGQCAQLELELLERTTQVQGAYDAVYKKVIDTHWLEFKNKMFAPAHIHVEFNPEFPIEMQSSFDTSIKSLISTLLEEIDEKPLPQVKIAISSYHTQGRVLKQHFVNLDIVFMHGSTRVCERHLTELKLRESGVLGKKTMLLVRGELSPLFSLLKDKSREQYAVHRHPYEITASAAEQDYRSLTTNPELHEGTSGSSESADIHFSVAPANSYMA